MINHITDDTFKDSISEGTHFVDFWAAWCGPCRMLNPILEDLSKDPELNATINKIDVDDNPKMAMDYGIRSIPTMLIFKDGELKETLVGLKTKEDIKEKILKISK